MKKYALIFLISIILVIAGCSQNTGNKSGESLGSPFIGGNKGIVAEFTQIGSLNENTNTEEVFTTDDFPIEIDVKNIGETAIEPGKVKVIMTGVALTDFEPAIPQQKLNALKLDGISEFNNEGSSEQVSLGRFKYKTPVHGNSIDLTFTAKIEYLYSTRATVPKVCFKGNPMDTSVCKLDEVKQVFSSAAPIQVKSATEKQAGSGKIAVEFEIVNVDGGDVTTFDKDFDFRYDQFSFTATPAEKWVCTSPSGSTGIVRFNPAGNAKITCTLKEALKKDEIYQQELGLTLDYKYKILQQKQLRVKKELV